MKNRLWMLFAALAAASNLYAYTTPEGDTTSFQKYESKIEGLTQKILRDTSRTVREASHKELQATLEEMLSQEGSYNYPFELPGISIIQPEDKEFRIFTWQLYQDKDAYTYGGYLQMKDGTVHKLDDRSAESTQPHFDRLSAKNWYGALYYSTRYFKSNTGKDMYVLFGYDAYSFFNRRKILDVLYFENGRPRFGVPVFEMKDGLGRLRTVSRLVLEYSATVTVGLSFHEDKNMIVYDHLVNGTPIPGGGPASIPDGSYEGLQLTDGVWKYVQEVFTDNPYYGNDNPPMPAPQFDNKKNKDLFGKNQRKAYRWMSPDSK